jgi:tRNA-splicing ligase RtcB (3'-phosphate/5'-hydroxy nucleic acid ligase)
MPTSAASGWLGRWWLLGGREVELVHNHHNFAWRERHDGEDLVVVRKGATPAFPGQRGFVGGSMGDNAVILQGTTSPDADTRDLQRRALFSTVHGAGRVMSRTEAAGKRHRFGPRAGELILGPDGRPKATGKVTREMMDAWVRDQGVVLRGGGLDEAPQVYRRLPEVLAEQGETVQVEHTLRPLIVVMAGANEFDPYKDSRHAVRVFVATGRQHDIFTISLSSFLSMTYHVAARRRTGPKPAAIPEPVYTSAAEHRFH